MSMFIFGLIQFARELMRKCGGLQTLVGCVMSHDYQKRRYGCMALGTLSFAFDTLFVCLSVRVVDLANSCGLRVSLLLFSVKNGTSEIHEFF